MEQERITNLRERANDECYEILKECYVGEAENLEEMLKSCSGAVDDCVDLLLDYIVEAMPINRMLRMILRHYQIQQEKENAKTGACD